MERPAAINTAVAAAGGVPAGVSSASPTSPSGPLNGGTGPKRKRGSMASIKSSPDSVGYPDGAGLDGAIDDEHEHEHEDKRQRQPGVKRACNECRQQKLRCTVIQDPFQSCTRCVRLRLECKIESTFKRVGKRSKQAEMARQIEQMRELLQQARAKGFEMDDEDPLLRSPVAPSHHTHTRNPSLMGSEEAVSSLLHLKSGGPYSIPPYKYVLGTIELMQDAVASLFHEYFAFYHPFIPFLPRLTPEQYFRQHPLLFWSVVAVGARRWHRDSSLIKELTEPLTQLVWKTVAELPTSYYVVKALCLLCTWRLPASTTSADPTHILCGVMMKLATGIGLHRPRHIQDFSRTAVDLDADQVHDRVITWAVCNIVAQSVGTGYGQPASTVYDWTLAVGPDDDAGGSGPFALSPELAARLRIEMFCDKVSKEMYSNASDTRGVAGDEHRSMLMRVYKREFFDLQRTLERDRGGRSRIVDLHLKAALLHLRLAGFYDSSTTPSYIDDLVALWQATTSFLAEITRDVDPHCGAGAGPDGNGAVLPFASNFLQQMLVAGGFSLLKLLGCSFFAPYVDFDKGRALFSRTVTAIRLTSVTENDLQWRLAELMVQMWNGHKVYQQARKLGGSAGGEEDMLPPIDDSLQLKVRCRHSMSLVFDTVWRWREEFLNQGRSSLEALKQATNPDSANESSASSTVDDPGPADPTATHGLPLGIMTAAANGAHIPGTAAGLSAVPHVTANGMLGSIMVTGGDPEYGGLYDAHPWMLDNLLDFNYVPPFQSQVEQQV